MCVPCNNGCDNDDHGDPDAITADRLVAAAKVAGSALGHPVTVEEACAHIGTYWRRLAALDELLDAEATAAAAAGDGRVSG